MGDIQRMSYDESDDGPFYMNAAKRIERKYDKPTGVKKQRKYVKSKLIAMLQSKGFNIPPGNTIKKVEEKCIELYIPLKAPKKK